MYRTLPIMRRTADTIRSHYNVITDAIFARYDSLILAELYSNKPNAEHCSVNIALTFAELNAQPVVS